MVNYLVEDLDGDRTIETPALVLDFAEGDSLALTGCSWGYFGEGPHGSALVLTDAGFFADPAAALMFVAAQDGGAPWGLDRPE